MIPSERSPQAATPTIKFFKETVEDVLAGRKTLEPRPRTLTWIKRLERAGRASLTYGPRFGAPTVFAAARITDITIRPFETATSQDLERIGTDWRGKSVERFVREYTRWFEKELAKGYPVAWISFEVVG
ncbi:MAG: ASCH domain-containing protein [Pseudonocardiaceae bacterium]